MSCLIYLYKKSMLKIPIYSYKLALLKQKPWVKHCRRELHLLFAKHFFFSPLKWNENICCQFLLPPWLWMPSSVSQFGMEVCASNPVHSERNRYSPECIVLIPVWKPFSWEKLTHAHFWIEWSYFTAGVISGKSFHIFKDIQCIFLIT